MPLLPAIIILAVLIVICIPIYKKINKSKEDKDELRDLDKDRR